MISTSYGVAVLLLTLAVFVALGVHASRRGGDVEDFVVARGSQGATTLGLSFLAAGMGAWILFAPPEVGARTGLVAAGGYAVGAAAPLVAFALLGPRIRRIVPAGHALTEFVRVRFGRPFGAWVAGVSVAYMGLFLTAELTAAGAVGQLLAGVDPRVTVTAVALATLGYTAVGGLRASLRTDRFQAWLILALLGVLAAALVGGVEAPGTAFAGSGLVAVDAAGLEVGLTLALAVTAANLFHQGYWQRVWAARSVTALGRGVGIGVASTLPVVAVVGALGVLAAGAGVVDVPSVALFALLGGLPAPVVAGVLVLAVALVASSVDTLETGLASLVAAESRTMSLPRARVLTVALVVPAVVVAVQGVSVLRLFLVADLLCAGVAVPALLGLWRRATTAGALSGAVAGLVGAVLPGLLDTGSLSEAVARATFPGAVPTLAPFLGALVASTVVAVGVSLAARSETDLAAVGARVAPLAGAAPRAGAAPHAAAPEAAP